MVWTAPEVTRTVPQVSRRDGFRIAPEPEMLRGLLDWHRATLLLKCAGLTGEQLARTPVGPSNLSLLGLVRHMAKVERIWFRELFRGEPVERLHSTPERPDVDFEDLDPARAEADYAQLLAEQEAARQASADASLDDTFVQRDGEKTSLRLIFNHMIAEYARHNGHADLIRQ
ncbi:MAG TPA: DinB family protein, partial [Micromonospora sp.]